MNEHHDLEGLLAQLGLSGQVHGSGEETVICLHGWLDNSNSFMRLFKHLSDHRQWISIDQVGHGMSNWRSNDAHYYFIDYVYDLLSLVDGLELEQCHLVGHSMGAMICGLFTSLYPSRVKTLTMIEGFGLVCTEPPALKQQILDAFKQRKSTEQFSKRLYSNFNALAVARSNAGDLGYENAALLMQRNTQKVEGGYYLTTDPRLKTQSAFRFTQAQALEILSDVHTPSLLIEAAQGYEFIQLNKSIFAKKFNNLQIEQVSGGHHCHMENPSQCAQIIEQHLNRFTVS